MVKLYGGEQPPPGPAAPWRYEVELVHVNEYVSRKEKPDPRGDDVMECDCRELPREKGEPICVDERCFNRATMAECIRCSKAACANQRLRKGLWAETEVRASGDKGWGLYLKEDIKVSE